MPTRHQLMFVRRSGIAVGKMDRRAHLRRRVIEAALRPDPTRRSPGRRMSLKGSCAAESLCRAAKQFFETGF
jgi:hypothetical protein